MTPQISPREPDVLVVDVQHTFSLEAETADVMVTIKGSSLVTGAAVFSRAKEVRELLQALLPAGFSEDDFTLEGLEARVSSFLKTKSASVTYTIRIHCARVDLISEVLGAVAAAKQAELSGIHWEFGDSAQRQAEELAHCARQANLKAKAAAEALGVPLLGVRRMTEQNHRPAPQNLSVSAYSDTDMPAQRSMGGAPDLGFQLSHRRTTTLGLRVEYRVGGFGGEPKAQANMQ